MAINCSINRNISFNQFSDDGSTSSCNSTDLSIGIGGILSPVYIYNISDIEGLKFENDNRADDTLIVDTIITDAPFYSIDFSSASYTEQYDDKMWTHTLTLTVANITSLFEDLLSDSVNGRYFVCFRPNGSYDYRGFGWTVGATLSYSLAIEEENLGYTITLECRSEYPLFSIYSDNFTLIDKVYTPLFKPLYSTSYCKMTGVKPNGYAVAMYVVKVNAAGQALDRNNKLSQWSGLKQDAYKLETVDSDGGYNILGTYNEDAVFDGLPVKVYNTDICPIDADGTITIDGQKYLTINLNSNRKSRTMTLHSNNSWQMLSSPKYVTVTPTQGYEGNTSVTIYHNNVGGVEQIVFQNRQTKERVTVTVNVNLIKISSEYVYQNGTTSFMLTPTVEGCSNDYTYTVTPTLTNRKESDGYIYCTIPQSDYEQIYTFTLTHSCDSDEVKTVKVTILGENSQPYWQVLSEFCEID